MLASPIAALEPYLDRWGAAHLCCEPANRAAAEEGLRLAYGAAGMAPPRSIVWCQGPIDIARRIAAASPEEAIGRNVKPEIFDKVRNRVGTFAEIFWKEVLTAAAELSNHKTVGATIAQYDRCKAVSAAVDRTAGKAAGEELGRVKVRLRHALLRLRGMPRLLPRWRFDEIAVSPHHLATLGVYEYLHDVLDWREQTAPMRGLWMIAADAGWVVPHEHRCWISERPTLLKTDTLGRLHCADGPALRYPDGWCSYAWKGVETPAWLVEHPEWITAGRISDTFEPVLRNCMIEILTPERFIRSGVVARVAEDETGILWRKHWSFRGVTVGSWAAVEVENGTPEPNGSRKHYFLRVPSRMRSAREAVAWTYGLTADEYARLEVRT